MCTPRVRPRYRRRRRGRARVGARDRRRITAATYLRIIIILLFFSPFLNRAIVGCVGINPRNRAPAKRPEPEPPPPPPPVESLSRPRRVERRPRKRDIIITFRHNVALSCTAYNITS